MKKLIIILLTALILTGCRPSDSTGPYEQTDGDMLVIGDRFFITQIMDLFINSDQHLGRTIQYEGAFTSIYSQESGNYYHFVFRYTLGCCGSEPIGLEVLLNGFEPLPDDTWVEVTGILVWHDGFLTLQATSLIEMEERGLERVSN